MFRLKPPLSFQKTCQNKLEILSVLNFDLNETIRKAVTSKVTFSIVLQLSLRVTKLGNEIKFSGVWGQLKANDCFQRHSFTKHLGETLVFIYLEILESFNFYFSAGFCQYQQNLGFCSENQVIILWSFQIFPSFPNFFSS